MEKAFVYGMSVVITLQTELKKPSVSSLTLKMALMLFLYLQDAWVRPLL